MRNRQSGIAKILLVIGVFVFLGIVITLLLSSGKKPTTTSTTGSTTSSTSGSTTGSSSSSGISNNSSRSISGPADVSNYFLLTNTTYGFSVGYPKVWGAAATVGNDQTSVSRYETPAINAILGNGKLSKVFGVYTYPAASFASAVSPDGPLVTPYGSTDPISWSVSKAVNSKYKSGDLITVSSVKTDTGSTLYDFAWKTNTTVSGAWAFKAGSNYVLVVLPDGTMGDGSQLSSSFSDSYTKLSQNIAKSVKVTAASN